MICILLRTGLQPANKYSARNFSLCENQDDNLEQRNNFLIKALSSNNT